MTNVSSCKTKKIQFIQIVQPEPKRKEQIVCALAADLLQQDKKLLIRVDPEQISTLDQALWRWPSHAFLPHAILPCDTTVHPILLADRDCQIEGIDTVIAGTMKCATEWLSQFEHVVDFAEVYSESLRTHSRRRFKFWQSLSLTPSFQKEFSLPEGF